MPDLTWTNSLTKIPGETPGEPNEYLSITTPNDDLIVHEDCSWSCPCLPLYRIVIGVHKEPGQICLCVMTEIVHNSLDGRELSE